MQTGVREMLEPDAKPKRREKITSPGVVDPRGSQITKIEKMVNRTKRMVVL